MEMTEPCSNLAPQARDRWTALDHRFLLPAISRLPNPWAQRLAIWRGHLHARFGRDWAELAVGSRYICERTRQAYAQIWPASDTQALASERYATVSLEELESHWISSGQFLRRRLLLQPVRDLLARKPADRGLVIITAHFDNVLLGSLGPGLCGARTDVMTTRVVEDARVHPAVQAHFARKYRDATPHLAGGSFVHAETAGTRFHRTLRQGGVVVVVADAPASDPKAPGVWVPWFGAQRRLASGALRIARATNSLMAAMLSVGAGSDTQHWMCHGPLDPWQDNEERGEAAYCEIFHFMETVIRAHPGRWWGAHLLEDCPTANRSGI